MVANCRVALSPSLPLSFLPPSPPPATAPRARDQRTYSKRQTALFVAASVKIASAKYSALHVHCIVEASSFASFAIKLDCMYEGGFLEKFYTLVALQPMGEDHAIIPHIKAMDVPFHMICFKALLGDRPKWE